MPPGWVEIVRDKKTRIPYIKENYKTYKVNEMEKDENSIIMDKLLEIYDKRKFKQIEFLGEDEYNKLFIFPNYEYFYFDRLDQEYEEELEKQREKEEAENQLQYGDYDNNDYNEY